MKSIPTIKTLIEETLHNSTYSRKQKLNKIEFLRNCKLYLETNPSEKFVAEQYVKAIDKRNKLNKFLDTANSEAKKEVEQFYDVSHLNQQIKMLSFLLS